MTSVVLNESVALAKGLPTFAALVRPCSCVIRSLAIDKEGTLVKRFLTVITVLVVFSSENLLILEKRVFTAKQLLILPAPVLAFSPGNGLCALKAALRLCPFECGLMLQEVQHSQEIPARVLTGDGLC